MAETADTVPWGAMNPRYRFLITGARAPAALQLARLLGRGGHEIVAADSLRHAAAYRSRWVGSHEVLPGPAEDFGAFVAAARDTLRRHAPDFVLCTCEEIFYWAKAAELHPREFRAYAAANPPFKTLRVLHDKGTFARLARRCAASSGIIVPETRVSGPLRGDGWVCKPSFSRFAVRTRLDLDARDAEAQIRLKGWIAQRQIRGVEFCTWACFVNGGEIASAAYQPLFRAGRGSGIGLRACDPGPAAGFARDLASRLRYTGQLAFDWIRIDAGCHVLECNPRTTSAIHFLDGKAVAFSRALGEALHGHSPETVEGAREDIALKWAMLLFGAPAMLRIRQGAAQRRFFREARDIDADRNDPGPTRPGAMLAALGEIVLRAVVRRSSLQAASTADIEWNGNRFWDGA